MTTTQYVTDGGLETDLIHHHGFDLPEFAAFPLLADERGRASLHAYYDGYAAIAAEHRVGLQLETPTWRANPDWGAAIGYDAPALARANADAVALVREAADRWSEPDRGDPGRGPGRAPRRRVPARRGLRSRRGG